ncbi:hypothetical protein [Streptomyces apocyni]|uniref:hypothetical protein n=1 Tax=Streptomyces apocyni TaxID=2654677 RepID=UPI0012E9E46B|nr:hypothetical protein [Streptomyces apocyni]
MGRGRRVALCAALLTAGLLIGLAGPGTGAAHAAGPCAGKKVRTLSFSTGAAHVYKSRGFLCAVARPHKAGKRQYMSVSVQARGARPVRNAGQFTQYAGPVKVYAGKRCVWVRGKVGQGSVSSGWILC